MGDQTVIINKEGDIAYQGQGSKSGDTGLPPEVLFYCGRFKDQCRCGKCNGYCGPSEGCPCDACVELLGFKVNWMGILCHKGAGLFHGGNTGIPSKDLYYCGQLRNQCHCRRCSDGRCGPTSGCPCHHCLNLIGLGVNDEGQLISVGSPNQGQDVQLSSEKAYEIMQGTKAIPATPKTNSLRQKQSFPNTDLTNPKEVSETCTKSETDVHTADQLFKVKNKRKSWVNLSSVPQVPNSSIVPAPMPDTSSIVENQRVDKLSKSSILVEKSSESTENFTQKPSLARKSSLEPLYSSRDSGSISSSSYWFENKQRLRKINEKIMPAQSPNYLSLSSRVKQSAKAFEKDKEDFPKIVTNFLKRYNQSVRVQENKKRSTCIPDPQILTKPMLPNSDQYQEEIGNSLTANSTEVVNTRDSVPNPDNNVTSIDQEGMNIITPLTRNDGSGGEINTEISMPPDQGQNEVTSRSCVDVDQNDTCMSENENCQISMLNDDKSTPMDCSTPHSAEEPPKVEIEQMDITSFSQSESIIKANHEVDGERQLCIICEDRHKTFVLIPCGHYSYCEFCCRDMTECAVCRSKVSSRVKIYEV